MKKTRSFKVLFKYFWLYFFGRKPPEIRIFPCQGQNPRDCTNWSFFYTFATAPSTHTFCISSNNHSLLSFVMSTVNHGINDNLQFRTQNTRTTETNNE
jgi:hypothetical protein